MANTLMALDTATIFYRAFHGVPTSLKSPDGTVINAVRGTLDAVAVLIEQFSPDVVAGAWDESWRPQWRVDLIGEYKSHRVKAGTDSEEDVPEDLTPQVPLVREALTLLGIPVLSQIDQEADDLLGVLARDWSGNVLVVSGDRDLFQLVDDAAGVSVIYTGAGMKKLQHVTSDWLLQKYELQPGHYLDFAALRGDASDGLPGVPGIGDKTAARLLTEFGNIEAILVAAHSPESALSPRVRENLLNAEHYLAAVKQVIAVGRYARPLASPRMVPPQVAQFSEFAAQYGLGRPAERALAAVQSLPAGE